MKVYVLHIHLANNEWSSHENGQIMPNVAREYHKQHPEHLPLHVTVYEHGGWWLAYFFDAKHDCVTVGTANDQANLSPEAHQIGRTYKGGESEYLPEIWRERNVLVET